MIEKMLEIMTTEFGCDDSKHREAYERLVKIANDFGAEVVQCPSSKESPYGWDGKTIRVESVRRAAYDLAHEIGHLMACESSRRGEIEFGLGIGFSTYWDNSAPHKVSWEVTTDEESYACLLAALLLDHVGMPNRSESELVSFTNGNDWYDDDTPKTVAMSIPKFIEWGLIDEELNLLFNLRP